MIPLVSPVLTEMYNSVEDKELPINNISTATEVQFVANNYCHA